MAEQMIEAYDTNTGKKLDRRVPAGWLDIFPHLSPTPSAKAAGRSATPSEDWTVKDLRAFADDHDIDLTGANTKAEILGVLAATPQLVAAGGGDPATPGQNKES